MRSAALTLLLAGLGSAARALPSRNVEGLPVDELRALAVRHLTEGPPADDEAGAATPSDAGAGTSAQGAAPGDEPQAPEPTMRVLRAHADALVTILEVVVRNPLYKWAQPSAILGDNGGGGGGNAGNAGSAGGGGGDAGGGAALNHEAERALLRIRDKLAGRVMSRSNEALAVEGQVRALLDEARDPENLCRMFDGWAAWL